MAAWLQPETDYRDAAIVVADTGMSQARLPRGLRDRAEDWVLLLRRQAHTRLHQGPLVPGHQEQCIVCKDNATADPSSVVAPDDASALHYRCQSCLLLWHDCCARRYVGPNDFGNFVCPACA